MSQQINLFNPALLTSKDRLSARMIAVLAGVTFMLMAAAYGWTSYRITQLASEQQAVTQQLTILKQQLDISIQQHAPRAPNSALQDSVAMAETTLKKYQQVQAFLQSGIFGDAQGFSGYMAAFARLSINGLWLTEFSIDDAVSKINISGRALRADLVPRYISRLGQEPILKGREFATLNMHAFAQPSLAAKVMYKQNDLPVPSIIEFKLQSHKKKVVAEAETETETSAAAGAKY